MERFERFSPDQRREIWDRVSAGESVKSIARSFHRYPSSLRQLLKRTGGIRPPDRTRSASTVSREVARNGGAKRYRATSADRRAWDQARRPKQGKLAECPRLRREVAKKLALKWSPEQISRWLAGAHPDDPEMHVSHETIYLSLFVQSRGELRRELHRSLRTGRVIRRSKQRQETGAGRIPGMVMISERPAEVEDRAVPGHWEGDLIVGSNHTCIATLVERSTRFVMLLKIERPTAEQVRDAMQRKIVKLPAELRRSVTWDQGPEMSKHCEFTVATGVPVYFCDPRSPWQRGTNENTNGLLRQYFPKGTDLSVHSQRDLDRVARELNGRPRKTLGWVPPLERLAEVLR